MKYIATIACASLLSLLSAGASSIDTESFGASLNGWKKNRTASYSINNSGYRTHQPTVTETTDGGMFVSTRIDRGRCFGSKGATCFLELTFSPAGTLTVGQIRINAEGMQLNTGAVARRVETATEGEEAISLVSPTESLVQELFTRLDSELAKLDKAEDKGGRRDILGRLSNSDESTANYSAALRHNLNLLLANVR